MSANLGTFAVRIVDSNGHPIENARVRCYFENGMLMPRGWEDEWTNEDGWATFDIRSAASVDLALEVSSIEVNDEEVENDPFRPTDGDTFSFTVDE